MQRLKHVLLYGFLLSLPFCLGGAPLPDGVVSPPGDQTLPYLASTQEVDPASVSFVGKRQTSGVPFTLDFPRLGMWWPDTEKQSLTDIARYDWVIFGSWDRDAAEQIKLNNPKFIALNSANACELGFNGDPDAEEWENEDVRKIPPEWFLTQVGSTLTADVNETETVFHVAEVTKSDGTKNYDLFVAGDTALIGRESVYIEAVNSNAKTLTVRRGFARPAIAHTSGTRIAEHVTFWPNSWVLDVSTNCPLAKASDSTEPENWAEYHARKTAGLLDDPIWDGILLDRSDPDESWLIGNSTARTIDPDRSNTLVTDYSAFDTAWNNGLIQFETKIRQAVGDDRIIFVNWGMANYGLLNGNNFEAFPNDDNTAYGTPWSEMVFGPTVNGSYFEWMANALQPNLTMIETYEDDGGPEPTGDGGYDNPCVQPGFTPNYRKMRFGLATALLNDGFYSYEINTNGHGSLCLMWFDEYDNAGKGRGYLGQPLGPARRVNDTLSTPNLVNGGGFDDQDDLDQWGFWAEDGNEFEVFLDNSDKVAGDASVRVDVDQATGIDWQVSLGYGYPEILDGTDYTLSFWAKADHSRRISAWIQGPRTVGYLGFFWRI